MVNVEGSIKFNKFLLRLYFLAVLRWSTSRSSEKYSFLFGICQRNLYCLDSMIYRGICLMNLCNGQKLRFFLLFIITITLLFISGCATEDQTWQEALDNDTVESYNAFLEEYPDGEYAREAKDKLELLLWREANKIKTIEGYEEYLEKYPNGIESHKAIERLEELKWQAAVDNNTIYSYEKYLTEYPSGAFSESALEIIEDLQWQKEAIADFVITDQPFGAWQKGPPEVEITIVGIANGGIVFRAERIPIGGGDIAIWCPGALHIWEGELTYHGYVFSSDEKKPLQFRVVQDKGYVFVSGKGTVERPDGTQVKLFLE